MNMTIHETHDIIADLAHVRHLSMVGGTKNHDFEELTSPQIAEFSFLQFAERLACEVYCNAMITML